MSTGTRRRGGKPKVRLAGSRRLVCAPKLPRESVVTIRSPADVAPIACRQPSVALIEPLSAAATRTATSIPALPRITQSLITMPSSSVACESARESRVYAASGSPASAANAGNPQPPSATTRGVCAQPSGRLASASAQ